MYEVLGEHRPDIWVSDLFSAQKNHPAPQWQVCECSSTARLPICDGCWGQNFCPSDEEVIIKGFYHPSTTIKNRRCQTQAKGEKIYRKD